MTWKALRLDPLVTMLVGAVLLANVVPATGRGLEWARTLSDIAIFLLFFVNGLRIERMEILRGLLRVDYFIPLLLWVFGVMALAGLATSYLAASVVPPLVALGFLYLGTLPSTVQSATSYTALSGGNTALSVVSAALLNVLGVFIAPPLFALLGGAVVADFGASTITRIGALLVLPLIIGLLLQPWLSRSIERHRRRLVWMDRLVIALAVYVAVSGAVGQGLASLISGGQWLWVAVLTGALLLFATAGAWVASAWLGFAIKDRIAFLFSASQKSIAIGAPLSALLFSPRDAGFVIVPLLLYHVSQLVIAAPIAGALANRATLPCD